MSEMIDGFLFGVGFVLAALAVWAVLAGSVFAWHESYWWRRKLTRKKARTQGVTT